MGLLTTLLLVAGAGSIGHHTDPEKVPSTILKGQDIVNHCSSGNKCLSGALILKSEWKNVQKKIARTQSRLKQTIDINIPQYTMQEGKCLGHHCMGQSFI